jgi:hypothetical protein
MRKSIIIAAMFSLLLGVFSPIGAYAFSNDNNGDGFVDSTYRDDNAGGLEFYETKFGSNNYQRVGVVNAYAITPYWNQQLNGFEYVRAFTDTEGVEAEFGARDNTVYPEIIYAKFKIGDSGGKIVSMKPTSGSNSNFPLAEFVGALTSLTTIKKLAEYAIVLAFITGDNGKVSDQEWYTSSHYISRDNWLLNTNGDTDLPTTISSRDAYLYSKYGFAAEFEYQDGTWSKGSAHTVEAIANIKYVMTLSNGLAYGYITGAFGQPHNTYGN